METPAEIHFEGMEPDAPTRAAVLAGVERLEEPEGREVAVVRTPTLGERYGDLAFSLNDTFKRARRRLQDHARRLRARPRRMKAGSSAR